ncbi:glycosyltransferase [Sinorhizobium medicae]|uniref:Glycosyltransferase n=3 Tax=Sinorhizobium medicae TaxID=110321 RepID=A0A6G1WM28_9HYPH|nr:glycosyltransferase [Sinorhizobium medicae]ABR62539.1 Cellulose synthase (UDP-forming) [Sinorhizobium medicae WSM419]MDX0406908.1 glycosyltransferase [Sinorhizobium medicae]MDX0412455.1 glycosyltransferase [Sinorhizobium medicae]MDX0418618.1 glycosyltransferase [Sinorhizobium medicae]MDX0424775.1 glycosyltransferase [Sinorhizobium medicae]
MVQSLLALAPTLLVLAFFLLGPFNWSRHKSWARAVTCVFVAAIALRYLIWRFTETVLPYPTDGANFYWVWFVFIAEFLAFSEVVLFLILMSRYVDRSSEADDLERKFFAGNERELPAVDVFIPTYNEPLDVLERTIVGALALDHPKDKLKVYVLDDGRRDWLKTFCEGRGAIHVTRSDNAHAKAGNMNNGLRASSGDFIAVFDADFVPYRSFLRRTLPFFLDETIGIVQTPQHFFNVDPIQSNLGLENLWPDEQRLFFDEIAPSRDGWDVSFCCGSCSIARRKAVDAIGGFPTESITEDLLTTLSMLNRGFKTRYLNERLSMGLAAENLTGYFVQRERWCQGGIQTLYLHNGPLRGPGLSLFQRVMFLPMSWLVQYLVRFIVLLIPIVYLWFGALPLYFTDVADYVSNQVPLLAAYFLLMFWLTPTRYLPLVSTAVGTFSTFRMLPTVLSSLVRPFGKPFKVTPKGSSNEENSFDAYTFTWIAGFIVVTALGLLINIVPETARIEGSFSAIAALWSGINIVVLIIASLICFEKPRRLLQAFKLDEAVKVDGVEGRLVSLSLDKAVVAVSTETRFKSTKVGLNIEGFAPLEADLKQVTQRRGDITRTGDKQRYYLHLHYDLRGAERDKMIVKLYTGRYSRDVPDIDKIAVSVNLLLRAFGRTRTA